MQNGRGMEKLMRGVHLASDMGLYISIAAVFILPLIVVFNIAMRRLSIPISLLFVEEYSAYLLIAITFLGAGYTLRIGKHVKITLLTDKLPERMHRWWDVSIASICLIVVILLQYYAVHFFLAALFSGERSDTVMATPLWMPRLLLVPGYLFLILEMIIYLIKRVNPGVSGART
jgi:TRAP-type C4-dicarboxylate transport system permease small subunit